MRIKKCAWCGAKMYRDGKEFSDWSKNSKFCGTICRRESFKRKIRRTKLDWLRVYGPLVEEFSNTDNLIMYCESCGNKIKPISHKKRFCTRCLVKLLPSTATW